MHYDEKTLELEIEYIRWRDWFKHGNGKFKSLKKYI